MKYYLGPWNQSIDGGELVFVPPAGTIGLLDLRSLPGHEGQTFGFFVTPDEVTLDPTSFELFGQAGYVDQITLTSPQMVMWASMLGLSGIDSSNLLDVLWETLTTKADPTGENAALPLMPTKGGYLELRLGGHSLVRRKRFNLEMPEAINCVAVMQGDYAEIRQRVLTGDAPADHHRRVLDYWGEKFGVNRPQDIFIPNGLPREAPLPHATTYTESFNQADSTTLGPDLTWTETTGNLEVESNVCKPGGTVFAEARAEHDLSGSDSYTQGVIGRGGATGIDSIRVLCRFASGARAHYGVNFIANDNYEIFKRVAGSYTSLASGSRAWADDSIGKVSADGSTIAAYEDETQFDSLTDTSIAGNLRGGISGKGATMYLDSFETGDIAGGATGKSNPIMGPMAGPLAGMIG
jgi:hypothetical protein